MSKGWRNFNSHWKAQILITTEGRGDGVKLGCTWSELEMIKLGCEIDDCYIIVTGTTIEHFFDKREVMRKIFEDLVELAEITDKTSSAILFRNDEGRKGPLADKTGFRT